jgi:hypothetical protein
MDSTFKTESIPKIKKVENWNDEVLEYFLMQFLFHSSIIPLESRIKCLEKISKPIESDDYVFKNDYGGAPRSELLFNWL